jgi:hypothetical protein
VSPARIRGQLRRRRHLTVLTATGAIVLALAVHHSGTAVSDMHHDMGMSAAVEMCLGVIGLVGAAVAAVALGLIGLGRWRPALTLVPAAVVSWAGPPDPRSRAGPALLSLLCISRR